jgi:hypothetical protein
VLDKLEWRVHPPTAIDFLAEYIKLLDNACTKTGMRARTNIATTATIATIEAHSQWLIELAVCDVEFRLYNAPTIALAALCHELPSARLDSKSMEEFKKMLWKEANVSMAARAVVECKSKFANLLSEEKNPLLLSDKKTTPGKAESIKIQKKSAQRSRKQHSQQQQMRDKDDTSCDDTSCGSNISSQTSSTASDSSEPTGRKRRIHEHMY